MTPLRQPARPVLVIDDDPFALKLLTRQLANLGFERVVPMDRSLDGLAAIRGHIGHDALVLLDLQMPDLDGIEFIRFLAQAGFDGELLLASGEHRRLLQAAVRLARAHGLRVLDALPKPVDPVTLATALAQPPASAPHRQAADSTPAWVTRDELSRALAAGELFNHYQPKVDLATGELVGVETLVRWQHPVHGLVPPEAFVCFAERNDMVHDITRGVLAGALRQMSAWDAAGLRLQVAVNISMDDLDDLQLPDVVAELAAREGGSLGRLVLEVTESRLMRDPLRAVDTLGRLRLKGVRLSIDDYGTGHSSLSQLRDLPFDELKLDRSFVRHSPSRDDLRCILESTLRMARTLELHSVAEGVETLEEWALLRDAGCDAAQGWLIGRPMAGPAIPAWREQWRARRDALSISPASGAADPGPRG